MTAITSEEQWLNALGNLPFWEPAARSLVVIAPHPDDEILGAGGLIAEYRRRGLPVLVIAVTDGEAAYPESIGLAATRRTEQERALEIVGVGAGNIVRLRMPDANVAFYEQELTKRVLSFLAKDAQIVAPWSRDPHPDHEACGRAAELAGQISGASLISYFFWTWHRFDRQAVETLKPRRFDLDAHLQRAKARALAEYGSQLQRENGDPILPYRLLAPARRPFETFVIHDC